MAAFDLPINDNYTSLLHSYHLRPQMTTINSQQPTPQAPPSQNLNPDALLDFISTVPPPVTRLLVELGPALSWGRWALQVANWRSGSRAESWLALAAFWGLCLGAGVTLKYMLPILILAPYILSLARTSVHIPGIFPKPSAASILPPLTTEETLSRALSDITIFIHLLPSFPLVNFPKNIPILGLGRLLFISYIPYLVLTHTIRMNIIVGIVGSIYLTWRAPWVRTTRHLVSNNGWVRYFARQTWFAATGQPSTLSLSPPSSVLSTITSFSNSKSKTTPGPSPVDLPEVPPPSTLRFRFTVRENQRWWMGLDWTAALLPQERASWTSSPPALHPLPPPISITLPTAKTVYLPASGKGRDHLRMKRTALWKWEEDDWGVVIKLSKDEKPERVGMVLPRLTPESKSTLSESLLQRGLQKVGSVDLPGSPTRAKDMLTGGEGMATFSDLDTNVGGNGGHGGHGKEGSGGGEVPKAAEEDDVTDAEGWTYGDNKWEGGSGKGGIGKYTRHRRWTRVAILTELVEIVPASEDPSLTNPTPTISTTRPTAISTSPSTLTRPSLTITNQPQSVSPSDMSPDSDHGPPSPTLGIKQAPSATVSAALGGNKKGTIKGEKEHGKNADGSLRKRLKQAVNGS